MFLSYSSYYLCESNLATFDPQINSKHLQEAILKTLSCYDELDLLNCQHLYSKNNRILIESLYIVLNLGDTDSLNRALNLPDHIKSVNLVRTSFKLSIDFITNNFYRILQSVPKLPHILAAVASLKLPVIRQKLLERFAVAFSNKMLTVPLCWLEELFYLNSNTLLSDLKNFNIEVIQDQGRVKFDRNQFDNKKSVSLDRISH
jgi:SAC3 domain-containing protein 1